LRLAGRHRKHNRKEGALAGQSGTTYKKRQRELARLDRQREKIAKRLRRKLEKQANRASPEPPPAE
jgi:hypothetical protein